MIDFRYHLVSIVSIFLALAVGIVLGAGPLQGELGDTLTNEVAGLREDKAQLNAQLSDATAEIDAREDYIGETNPAILADSLDGQRVAVVVLPGTDTALVESTATSLASSGAAVVSTTTIGQNWVSTDEAVVTARRHRRQRHRVGVGEGRAARSTAQHIRPHPAQHHRRTAGQVCPGHARVGRPHRGRW